MIPVIVVAIFAVVQSLFGVGLLVFGTPTLLLLGHSFAETLAILLPASVTVSLLQVWAGGGQTRAFARVFAWWCLVPLVATLAAVLMLDLHASLNLVVAALLALFAALRMFPRLGAVASAWVARHERPWLTLMGVVHGLSNLGGGLLMILAAARHRRKEDVRAFVAFCYVCFAATQLAVVGALTPAVFSAASLGYALLGGAVFLLLGQRMFLWVSSPVFERLLTLCAAAYAGVLGLRSTGIW